MQVVYAANDPHGARIDDFMEMWFVPVLLGAMGAVFLGVSVGLYWFRRA